jgi:ribosome-associated protein
MIRNLDNELIYSASRSSGAGGQNVNKVNTRVELRIHIATSALLTDDEKAILAQKLANRINNEGFMILSSQTERSQLANKEKVTERFYLLVEKALIPQKARKATKPTKASKEKRLDSKRKVSEKKSSRRPKISDY